MNNTSPFLQVDLIYSPIIDFAMQQNHVPVIRKLTIKNIGESDLSNIQIQIIPEPEFAVEWNKKIDFCLKEEMMDMGAIDIKTITKYPAELIPSFAQGSHFALIRNRQKSSAI